MRGVLPRCLATLWNPAPVVSPLTPTQSPRGDVPRFQSDDVRLVGLHGDELHAHAHLRLSKAQRNENAQGQHTSGAGSTQREVLTWNPSIRRCSSSQFSYRHCVGFHFCCSASSVRLSSARSTSRPPTSPRAWRTNIWLKRVLNGSPPAGGAFVMSCGAAVCGDDRSVVSSSASHCDGALSSDIGGIRSGGSSEEG